MKLSQLKTDSHLERTGNWVAMGHGLKLNVSRLGNPEYQSALLSRMRALGPRAEDPEAVTELVRDLFGTHILHNWDGLTEDGPNGTETPVPYSKEKAVEMLRWTDFYRMVEKAASTSDNFRKTSTKESAGN